MRRWYTHDTPTGFSVQEPEVDMPDDNGKLNDVDKVHVLKWLEEKAGGGGPCPACGKTKWMLMEEMGSVPIYSAGHSLFGPVYPAIVLTCRHCGNMRLFNAVVIGTIPPPSADILSQPVESIPGGDTNAS